MKIALRAALFGIPLNFAFATSAQADCKERVDRVRDEIERDKDKYTRESRTEANKHLMQANLPSLSPMQCTEQISRAKKALREGKQQCLGFEHRARRVWAGNSRGNLKFHRVAGR